MAHEDPAKRFVIGVDGGGTSTDCAIVSLEGKVLARSSTGPSNPRRVGLDASVESVRRAVVAACSDAGPALPGLWACYCIAGAGAPDVRVKIQPRLEALGLARGVTVDHDARAALVAAHGFAPGVVVIAGTGAIAFAQDGSGGEVQIDGWGPLLGDEGSGYWIGLQALKAVARASDGRGPATELTQPVLDHFGISSARELVQTLPLDKTNSELVAGLARVCIESSRRDDPVARRIVREAAACLATSAVAAVRSVSTSHAVRVALVGGVATCPDIAKVCREVLRAECPHVVVVEAAMPQSVGAALMALRAAGVSIGDELVARLRSSASVD